MKGIMIDCSRNAVMTPEAIKRFVNIISALGYDTLMLYTEDTYEVDGEPLFGYQRGRYSKDELRDVDNYCFQNKVELVPCIQTLAHLNSIFKWSDEYEKIRDYDDILLVDDERTYKLIDRMFSSLASCLRSRRIHIGMDEAYMVGLGKYLEKHGSKKRFDIINRHLHKVCVIAEKYGFSPMIWSDMFCKLAAQSGDYYGNIDIDKICQRADLPQNITLVYWDYYSTDYERYVRMLETNKAFDRPVAFAGGAWTWRGFIPANKFSMENTETALKACRRCGIEDILITMWGDDGGECSRFAVLPALTYTALQLSGKSEELAEKFRSLTGIKYEDFMLLDSLDKPFGIVESGYSKLLLYNDPFTGAVDSKLDGSENKYYENLLKRFTDIAVSDDYRLLFNYAEKLCNLLSVKADLGLYTRAAYSKNNLNALRKIAEEEYTAALQKLDSFYSAYREFWFSENKPQGFDVQDIRFGGLQKRLESCKTRILEYCSGKSEGIPELEEALIDTRKWPSWARTVTPNVISHIV